MNTKQKKFLKARAHSLKPVVTIGQHGLKQTVIDEVIQAVDHHELVKLKLPAGDKAERVAMLETLCQKAGCDLVNLIGRTGLVFKAAKETKFALPK